MAFKNFILIFPTDTVYGIGAKLYDLNSYNKIFEIKNRNQNKPLPLLIGSIKTLKEIAIFKERDLLILKQFWPGALTCIFKTCDSFKNKFKLETIAVRIPKNKIALKLVKKYGPIWTTSLNNSGEKPISDKKIIKEKYRKLAAKIYFNNKNNFSNTPSTIIDLTNGSVKLLREGEIKLAEINALIKEEI